MKKANVQIGATYLVKVAGNLVPVKITHEHDNGGWVGVSVKTGKTICIKSPQCLRKRLANAAAGTKTLASQARHETRHGRTWATGGEPEGKPMSLLNAAAHILSLGAALPMRCKDIVDLAIDRGLWSPRNGGKTPANSLHAAIQREIKAKGSTSRFRLAERGKFALADRA